MRLDPYKNWIQVDPVFEFLKLLLCCDVALSSPIGFVKMRLYIAEKSRVLYIDVVLFSLHRMQILYVCVEKSIRLTYVR